MTQSPFNDKPDIRKYSVLPARAIQDDEMHWTTLRVLGAICLYTNAYGIAWPSRMTIARHISRSTKTVSVHVSRLIKQGYVRKLHPRSYPAKIRPKNTWRTNRYQVLFDGAQTELPSLEQFWAPRPKLVAEDMAEEAQSVTHTRRESEGGNDDFKILAQAFVSGVQMASGQNRLVSANEDYARVLAQRGVQADKLKAATVEMTRANLKKGRTPPLTIEQVATWAALC
jgi:hypothetical protein